MTKRVDTGEQWDKAGGLVDCPQLLRAKFISREAQVSVSYFKIPLHTSLIKTTYTYTKKKVHEGKCRKEELSQ